MKHLMGLVNDVVYGGVHETTSEAIYAAVRESTGDKGGGEMEGMVYGELNDKVENAVNLGLERMVYGPVWGGVCDAVGVIG